MPEFRNSTAAGRVKAAAARLAAAAARVASTSPPDPVVDPPVAAPEPVEAVRPAPPAGVPVFFLPLHGPASSGEGVLYRPALLGSARVHFSSPGDGIDLWEAVALLAPLGDDLGDAPWDEAETLPLPEPALEERPDPAGRFAPLPSPAERAESYEIWSRALSDVLRRGRVLTLLSCRTLGMTSKPGESEAGFRTRLTEPARGRRDEAIETLRGRTAARIAGLQNDLRAARERAEARPAPRQPGALPKMIALAAAAIGALFGRRAAGAGSIGSGALAPSEARRGEARPEGAIEILTREIASLEMELRNETTRLEAEIDPASGLRLEERTLRPGPGDIAVGRLALVWTPWRLAPDGSEQPAFR